MDSTNKQKEKRDYSLNSVRNALRLLKCFTMDEPEKKVTDLAKDMNLSKSTVSRLLQTLASEGFISKNPETQKYRLGLSVLCLSGVVISNLELHREAMPVLRKLVDQVEETAHIAVLEDMDIIYLQKIECTHPVRILTHIGRKNPAHCTSAGKLLLAYQDPNVVKEKITAGLTAYTEKTITSPEKFLTHLALIRKNGYAVSVEEFRPGIVSVAAPIRDYTKQVIACVNIVGPIQRIQPQTINKYVKHVVNAGKEISERLGYKV